MFIMNNKGLEVINSQFVERFCISIKPDAALIVASYSDQRAPVTVARYADAAEAKEALVELSQALAGGTELFYMPDSRLFFAETERHDARVKRKGGS